MIIARKVIAQWLDISNISDEEIATALNSLGFEVEKVRNLRFANSNLVVGVITKITKHPQSNKLNICEVDNGSELLTIICGASNVAVGIKVVVAQINSTLANGLTIISRTIIDTISHGMICSLSELGLASSVQSAEELKGIVHLPATAVVGNTNPLQYLALDETLFFIDVTVNRSDCFGAYNIARELAAYFNLKLQKMAISNGTLTNKKQVAVTTNKIKALATLKISYHQPTTLKTPLWMRRILQLADIMPHTFTIDISNFIMLELGQPLIAFNGDVLTKPNIMVAAKSYPEGTLKIFHDDLLWHDDYLVFSVLGINYKSNYEVNIHSKSVYLFSINVDNITINQQVKRHNPSFNLLLERMIKPIKPDYYLIALQRYLLLLEQLQVGYDIVAFSNDVAYEITTTMIPVNFNDINKLLGTTFTIGEISHYLMKSGCQVTYDNSNNHLLKVTVPSHRNDLNNSNDLSEEVARIVGYDNLPTFKPQVIINLIPPSSLNVLLQQIRQHWLSFGFNRVKTYSLTSKEELTQFNFFNYQTPLQLLSPLTSTREVMRFNITSSLVKICQYNYARKVKQLKVCSDEVIYSDDDNGDQHHFAFAVMGSFLPDNVIKKTLQPYDFIKGMFDGFCQKIAPQIVREITYKATDSSQLHPYLSANCYYRDQHIATIGSLHPQTEKLLAVENVFVGEINMTKLAMIMAQTTKNIIKFKPWSRFNVVARDISLVVSHDVIFNDIKTKLLVAKIPHLVAIKFLDFYVDEKLQAHFQHSLTFQLQFNNNELQLDDKAIAESMNQVQKIITDEFKAIIR